MQTLKEQLRFDLEGSLVKRYHTASQLQVNTDGHHQRSVAVLCRMLSYPGEARLELIYAALFHDQAEHVTSDVSAPAKRALGISKMLHDVETGILRDNGINYEDSLTADEQRILKLADILDGGLWQIHERQLGNRYSEIYFNRFYSYLRGMIVTPRERDVVEAITELWEEATGERFNETTRVV